MLFQMTLPALRPIVMPGPRVQRDATQDPSSKVITEFLFDAKGLLCEDSQTFPLTCSNGHRCPLKRPAAGNTPASARLVLDREAWIASWSEGP